MKVKCNCCKSIVPIKDLVFIREEEYEVPVAIYQCPVCKGELNDLQSDIIDECEVLGGRKDCNNCTCNSCSDR